MSDEVIAEIGEHPRGKEDNGDEDADDDDGHDNDGEEPTTAGPSTSTLLLPPSPQAPAYLSSSKLTRIDCLTCSVASRLE